MPKADSLVEGVGEGGEVLIDLDRLMAHSMLVAGLEDLRAEIAASGHPDALKWSGQLAVYIDGVRVL